jgi:hypothetical protein
MFRIVRWRTDDDQKILTAELGKSIEGDTQNDRPYGDGSVAKIEWVLGDFEVWIHKRPTPIHVRSATVIQSDSSKAPPTSN